MRHCMHGFSYVVEIQYADLFQKGFTVADFNPKLKPRYLVVLLGDVFSLA